MRRTVICAIAVAGSFLLAGCGSGGRSVEATIGNELGSAVRNCRADPGETRKWKHLQSTFRPPVHDYFYDVVWRCDVPSDPGPRFFVLRDGKYYGDR